MSQRFDVRLPLEEAYHRRVLFAIELLDAVTLSRVSQGVKVTADGLQGKPILNTRGMFVWLDEDINNLQQISIDPGTLPYQSHIVQPAEVKHHPPGLTTIELQPRVDYDFASGVTGLRGRLIEELTDPATPVGNAAVRLQWLDDASTWHIAPTTSYTDQRRGDFVSILRLAPTEVPHIENGELTVRLRASRGGGAERSSNDFKLNQGRITDPSTSNPLTFAWDDLQP
jgi:hypothetical protein